MKTINIGAVVAMVVVGSVIGNYVYAGCGSCGPKPEVKDSSCTRSVCGKSKACPEDCAKPCCSEKKAKACGSSCKKPSSDAVKEEEHAVIDTHTLETLIKSNAKVTVLDARSGKWDDGRRVPGAKALSPDASAKDAAKLIPSKDSLVVTYCSNTKCPASGMLANSLKKLGYNNVLEYPVGIAGWAEHGNAVEQAK